MGHNLKLKTQKYSEKELENNINLFNEWDWYYISYCQVLSEGFIEKYSDKVEWYDISKYQILSESFIKRNINKINIHYLMMNKNISEEIKKEINLLKEII